MSANAIVFVHHTYSIKDCKSNLYFKPQNVGFYVVVTAKTRAMPTGFFLRSISNSLWFRNPKTPHAPLKVLQFPLCVCSESLPLVYYMIQI
jgi:hypothetical protein